ncbi:MAG: SDR family oxidoreductase [Gemmatimonadaceae bacterium]
MTRAIESGRSAAEGQAPPLSDRLAIVTGAAGLLGSRFSRALLVAGARVVGLDVTAATIDLPREVKSDRFTSLVMDLSDEHSVVETASQIEREFGAPDVVVNNAATKSADVRAFFRPFEETSTEVWNEVLAVNITGMMLMCREYGRRMIEHGKRGTIVNIASVYGVVAPDQRIYEGSDYPDLGGAINTPAIYSTSKAAVIGLTRYLAAYWGHAGIRVNAISPGGVSSGQNATFQQNYSRRVPMGRMAEGQEIEGALIYLASDASSYVTGQNIVVDGGLTAW